MPHVERLVSEQMNSGGTLTVVDAHTDKHPNFIILLSLSLMVI